MKLSVILLAALAALLLAENGYAQVLFRGNQVPFQKPRPRRNIHPRFVTYAQPRLDAEKNSQTPAPPGLTIRPATSRMGWLQGRSGLGALPATTSTQPALTNRPMLRKLIVPVLRSALPQMQAQPRFFLGLGSGYDYYDDYYDDYYYDYPMEYYEEYYYDDYPYYWRTEPVREASSAPAPAEVAAVES